MVTSPGTAHAPQPYAELPATEGRSKAQRPCGRDVWLFSRKLDIIAFGAPVLAAALLALFAPYIEDASEQTPAWAWLATVLLVDVAHVYGTLFRVYTDPQEMRRHPRLYIGVPMACLTVASMLYTYDFMLFWRAIAYAATWHFIRQQIGWVRLYGRREGARAAWHGWLDDTVIYAITLYSLIWWHTHLPRRFAWMMQDDFVPLPTWTASMALPSCIAVVAAYAARMVCLAWHGRSRYGKDMVVLGTLVCWVGGIVMFDSDYIFTVTNVLLHGVPYMVLIAHYRRHRQRGFRRFARPNKHMLVKLLLALWILAFVEEWLWDHTLWHGRSWLFGSSPSLTPYEAWLVPMLAVPQLTHYVLDGFIWRRAGNPSLRGMF